MIRSEPVWTRARRIPGILGAAPRRVLRAFAAGLRVAVAAIAGAFGYRLVRIEPRDALGEAHGAIPKGTTVFDDRVPGVVNLDLGLLAALRKAATAAADDGVELFVNSGWRSPEYQDRLRRNAVAKYGSEEEAARWVATPEKSIHVAGGAADIGPPASAAWLSGHGAAYGLCQIYRNEPWHYELRPEAIEHGCPPMLPDPSHDPRLRP